MGAAGLIGMAQELAGLNGTQAHFRWWWPTDWMAIPAAILAIGVALLVFPVRRAAAAPPAVTQQPAVPAVNPAEAEAGLEVVIDREIPTAFPGAGIILEIEYRVTNHDPMDHTLFKSIQCVSPFHFGPHGITDDSEDAPLWQAFRVISERRRGDELPTSVGSGETVRGVQVVEFGWDPVHNLPDYTLIIGDGRREFPVRPHGAVESTSARPEPPPFTLRHHMRPDPLYDGWVTSHFVAVTNLAGQPERRVRMSAERMDPYPRRQPLPNREERPVFPHAVPPESGGSAAAGLVIGPGQERSWYIGNTSKSGDGKINVSRFFSETRASWELGPDESWRLCYAIACGGRPEAKFTVVMAVEDGDLTLRLEGG